MKRTIVTPPDLPAAALDELKDWLAITTTAQDGVLTKLLRAALETCEGFTGQMPLECECEEVLSASSNWQRLSVFPIHAISRVDGLPAEGPPFVLSPAAYAIDLDADGGALVRTIRQGAAGRIVVQFLAGIAPDWASLPAAVKQGIIRLAAHSYGERDAGNIPGTPPMSVAALWRPWRRMRLL